MTNLFEVVSVTTGRSLKAFGAFALLSLSVFGCAAERADEDDVMANIGETTEALNGAGATRTATYTFSDGTVCALKIQFSGTSGAASGRVVAFATANCTAHMWINSYVWISKPGSPYAGLKNTGTLCGSCYGSTTTTYSGRGTYIAYVRIDNPDGQIGYAGQGVNLAVSALM